MHALGLAHPGNYEYGQEQSILPNGQYDHSRLSNLSYFSSDGGFILPSVYLEDNPEAQGSTYLEAYTPMLADLYAIEMIYGTENTLDNVNVGNTVHKIPNEILDDPWGITITDLSDYGIDVINLLNTTNDNILYLEPGYGSSLDGRDYNFFIYWDSKIENVIGSNQNDTIFGNALNNHIGGAIGDDIIFGQGGQDTIYGDAGNDRLYGGMATDLDEDGNFGESYTVSNGEEIHETENLEQSDPANANLEIYGGSGNDYILGGRLQDTLFGEADNDTIYGEDGEDILYGGEGQNFLYGGENSDILKAGNGIDTLDGGNGSDLILGESYYTFSHVTETNLPPSGDKIYGGNDSDIILAGYGDDTIHGGDNPDFILGNKGDDTLFGGSGGDNFYFKKGDGTDTIEDLEFGDTLEFEQELLFSTQADFDTYISSIEFRFPDLNQNIIKLVSLLQ